jgi:hypothetical protein
MPLPTVDVVLSGMQCYVALIESFSHLRSETCMVRLHDLLLIP